MLLTHWLSSVRSRTRRVDRRRNRLASPQIATVERLEDRTLLSSVQLVDFAATASLNEILTVSDVNLQVTSNHDVAATVSFNSSDNPVGNLTVGATTSVINGTVTGTVGGETLQNGTLHAPNSSANVQYTYAGPGLLNVVITQTGNWSGTLASQGQVGDTFEISFSGQANLVNKTLTGTTQVTVNAPVPGGKIIYNEAINASITTTPNNWEAPNDNLAWIGKRVWHDVDGDGVQDNNEFGLGGITVELFAVQGTGPDTLVDTTQTDVRGYYRFTNLNSGNYWLKFSGVPSGFAFTQKDIGDDFDDNDADSRGITDEFFLAAGQNDGTHDAGLVQVGVPGTPTVTGPNGTINTTRPTITWTAVANAATYDLLSYDLNTGQSFSSQQNLSGTSYAATIDWPVSTNQVFIRGVNAAGQAGPWSAGHTFVINSGSTPPSVPVITGPVGTTNDTTPTITWNAVNQANHYEIVAYDLNSGQQIVFDANVGTNSYTPTSAWPATRVQVFVRIVTATQQKGVWSAPFEFTIQNGGGTALPGKPVLTGPNGTISDNTPTITWNAAPNAADYDLLAYDLNTGQQIAGTEVAGTSYTPSSPWPDSQIQVFVLGVNSADQDGPWSDPLVFTIQSGSPAPGTVTITGPNGSTNDDTPTITWNAATNAATYDLLAYDLNSGQQVASVSGLTSTNLTPGSAWPSSTMQVFVRGVNSSGTAGAWSTAHQFDIQGSNPAPGTVTITGPNGSTSDDTPTITWNAATNAATYDLLAYDLNSGQQVASETSLNSMPYTPGSAWPASTMQVFVRGVNASGVAGAWSSAHQFDIQSANPVPGQISITGPTGTINNATPTFSWTGDAAASTYQLLAYNTGTGQEVLNETQIQGTSLTPTNPLPNAGFQFFVRGVNAIGQAGPWSSPANVTIDTRLPAPTLGAPGTVTQPAGISYSWNTIAGASGYEIVIYDTKTGTQVAGVNNLTGTSYTSASFQPSTYQAFLRAIDANGQGGHWSQPVFSTVESPVVITKLQTGVIALTENTPATIDLAIVSGGTGPYTITLESGVGFQPLGMNLNVVSNANGTATVQLVGTPSVGSASPFTKNFGICAKDLSGFSDCTDSPFQYNVSPQSNPSSPFSLIDNASASGVPWVDMVVSASGRVGAPVANGLWEMTFDVFDWTFTGTAQVTSNWTVVSVTASQFKIRRDPGQPEVANWTFVGHGLIGAGLQVNMRARLGGPNHPWIDDGESVTTSSS